MLNARLYRTAWLIAGVAIIVALLSLQPPADEAGFERPANPPGADGAEMLRTASALRGLVPRRPPGEHATEAVAATFVEQRLRALPSVSGVRPKVRRQVFTARVDGQLRRMVNVYAVLPGTTDGIDRGGIVVVAPRDTGPGVTSGSSSTAVMLGVANIEAASARRRPMLFVSTSGSTTGNAGARWFLSRFSDFHISAVIVLDGLGEREGPVWIWPGSRAPLQSLGFADIARASMPWSGAKAAPAPGLWTQLLRFAVPQTFGDQAPFVEKGIPAVTLSSRPDGPARPVNEIDASRLRQAGNVVITLMTLVDNGLPLPAPEAGVLLSGKELRPGVLRVVLLLFALPLLVTAVDAFVRLRRSGVSMAPGLRAAVLRGAPLLTGAFVLHLMALLGMLPPPSAGVPPLPRFVGFGSREAVSVALALALAGVVWLLTHRSLRRMSAPPASEAAAALVVLGVVSLLAWLVTPFALVLTLPASHAVLIATSVTRRWQAIALGVAGLLPLLALCVSVGSQLGRNPLFAAWYLIATTAGGARGSIWPMLVLLLTCAVWSMAVLVVIRYRKGLMRHSDRPPRVPRRVNVPKARLPRISR